jgi:hypothetical protein
VQFLQVCPPVRVRIIAQPDRLEVDGVRLESLVPGQVREVSASVGAWLIAEGFAVLEMRHERVEEFFDPRPPAASANDAPAYTGRRRRRTDR